MILQIDLFFTNPWLNAYGYQVPGNGCSVSTLVCLMSHIQSYGRSGVQLAFFSGHRRFESTQCTMQGNYALSEHHITPSSNISAPPKHIASGRQCFDRMEVAHMLRVISRKSNYKYENYLEVFLWKTTYNVNIWRIDGLS